eukprot:gene2502-4862_t
MHHPSEILTICIILEFIEAGRRGDQTIGVSTSLNILSFLSDIIESWTSHSYPTIISFENAMMRYNIENSFISPIFRKCKVTSVDNLIDIMESLRDIFENPPNVITNNAIAPTCVTQDSFIGVYVRSHTVRWESTNFHEIGCIYDSLQRYMTTRSSLESSSNEANSNLLSSQSSIENISDINNAIGNFDVRVGEDNLHLFYDSTVLNPLGSKSQSPIYTQQSLSTLGPLPSKRHQQAMLSLATLWVRNGNFAQAISAIDEAMKTAHHRGDHVSIARALLLLHHVADQILRDEAADVIVSAEDALIRCLGRSIALKMKALCTQAAILLVRHRSKGSMTSSASSSHTASDGVGHQDDVSSPSEGVNRRSVQSQWMLLAAAQMNDPGLIARISGITVSNDAQSSGNKVAGQNNVSKKDVPNESHMSYKESAVLSVQAALVAVEVWRREGLLALAEQQCRLALHIFGYTCGVEELISLCCSQSKLRCELGENNNDIIVPDVIPGDRPVALRQCAIASNVLDLLDQFIRNNPVHLACQHVVTIARTYVQTRDCTAAGNFNLALGHVKKLVEFTKDTSRQPTAEHLQALIMRAKILSHMDIPSAVDELNGAMELADASELYQSKGEALLARALVCSNGSPIQRSDALLDLRAAMRLSQRHHLPLLEKLSVIQFAHFKSFV